jgi:hypothetical protein
MAHASFVLWSVRDNRCAVTCQLESKPKLLAVGGVKRLARNVAVRDRVHFRVEIVQPHVDPKGRKAEAERAPSRPHGSRATRGKPSPSRDNPSGRLAIKSEGVG